MSVLAPASLAPPTADNWREIFALLDTALELEPSARAGWLATLGPEQAALSPWLEELLRAHAAKDTADFMRDAATFALDGEAAPTAPGADLVVGPYHLLREIGEGGMATVWLAERADGLLERKVAVKLPQLSWGMASFADRMARERNILASLTHPNIARLYDAGLRDDLLRRSEWPVHVARSDDNPAHRRHRHQCPRLEPVVVQRVGPGGARTEAHRHPERRSDPGGDAALRSAAR